MGFAVVNLVEIGDGLKVIEELWGVFKPGVVIAPDQVLAPLQAAQGVPGHIAAVVAHIAHHIDSVPVRDGFIPEPYYSLIHLLHGSKGPAGQKRFIMKMKVSSIKNHPDTPIAAMPTVK